MRGWLGEEAEFKLLAFVTLLPLAALNLFVIFAGIAVGLVAEPVAAGIGLAGQLALMNEARHSPRGAGISLLAIGLGVGVLGAGLGYLSLLWFLIFLAPFPAAVILIYAGTPDNRARRGGTWPAG